MTNEDVKRIANAVCERFKSNPPLAIADAVYQKLDENALSDIRGRLDRMDVKIDSMAEDLTKVMERTEEIPLINENIAALREHAGI